LQNNCDSWIDAYVEQKNDIEKMQKKIVYNFNRSNNFDIEWDNLKSQVKEYTKIRQTNGWEFFFFE